MNPKLHAISGLLVLMLVGCGPSVGERRLKTELEETQKKLVARTEEAETFSTELEVLRKQLSGSQDDLNQFPSEVFIRIGSAP